MILFAKNEFVILLRRWSHSTRSFAIVHLLRKYKQFDIWVNSENYVVSHETTNLPLSIFKWRDFAFIIFSNNRSSKNGQPQRGVLSSARLFACFWNCFLINVKNVFENDYEQQCSERHYLGIWNHFNVSLNLLRIKYEWQMEFF